VPGSNLPKKFAPNTDSPSDPQGNNRKRWRLAYYQGGNFVDFAANLRALIPRLSEIGLIKPIDLPNFDSRDDAETIWSFLSKNVDSHCLEFVPDAYWSAAWDETWRSSVRQTAMQRLSLMKDIDFVLAMGTWAGQDLVNDQHSVPTLVLTSSDPIEAGIIESYETSGFEHILVEVDPERYRRQIRFYHEVLKFKRLGVAYDHSEDGRVYANIADLEYVAQERGFALVQCQAAENPLNEATSLHTIKECYAQLAPKIDAQWIGLHIGEQTKYMPQSLEVLINHKIPTITSVGPTAVKRGVMLSYSYTNTEAASKWYAGKMAEILKGARPGELNPVFEMPGYVVINLETARRTGCTLHEDLLKKTHQKFETIEGLELRQN
jgi:ABC-type uncharacterized transport system substrate-binding protein